jgi:hypothetical protein
MNLPGQQTEILLHEQPCVLSYLVDITVSAAAHQRKKEDSTRLQCSQLKRAVIAASIATIQIPQVKELLSDP